MGFDWAKAVSAAGAGGFGLFSIRERLEQVGGRLEIDSELGRGTTVTIKVPLRQEKNGGDDKMNVQ